MSCSFSNVLLRKSFIRCTHIFSLDVLFSHHIVFPPFCQKNLSIVGVHILFHQIPYLLATLFFHLFARKIFHTVCTLIYFFVRYLVKKPSILSVYIHFYQVLSSFSIILPCSSSGYIFYFFAQVFHLFISFLLFFINFLSTFANFHLFLVEFYLLLRQIISSFKPNSLYFLRFFLLFQTLPISSDSLYFLKFPLFSWTFFISLNSLYFFGHFLLPWTLSIFSGPLLFLFIFLENMSCLSQIEQIKFNFVA